MKTRTIVLHTAIIILATACTSSPPPQVAPTPQSVTSRVDGLVSPVVGWSEQNDETTRTGRAWDLFKRGQITAAEEQWRAIESVHDSFPPALLGLAAVAINDASYERAAHLIDEARKIRTFAASEIYAAELALLLGDIDQAVELLGTVTGDPAIPNQVASRHERIRRDYANQIASRAATTSDPEQRAEMLDRASEIARLDEEEQILLIETWLELGRPDAARQAVDQLLLSGVTDDSRIEALVAEIEIAEHSYSSALKRYQRLVDQTGRADFANRLERVKVLWHESTLPEQFQRAVESPAITREDLAVLMFWKIPEIRFARRLGQPPIAIDIEDVRGREELVRSLALGLLSVDSGTRRAAPQQTVTAGRFIGIAAKIMELVAPALPCTGVPIDRPLPRLTGCGIETHGLELDMQRYVDGRTAYEMLEQIAGLSSKDLNS